MPEMRRCYRGYGLVDLLITDARLERLDESASGHVLVSIVALALGENPL